MRNYMLLMAAAITGTALAFTTTTPDPDVAAQTYPVQIRSKTFLSLYTNAEPEQSNNYLESYLNPLSLTVVDSQLDSFSTFAVNNSLLNWEAGYAVKTRKGELFLCQTQNLDESACVKIYRFVKHGLSKNPIDEVG